jgi:hypothetical protein
MTQMLAQLSCSFRIVKNEARISPLEIADQSFNCFFGSVSMLKNTDEFVDMFRASDFFNAKRMIMLLFVHFSNT